MKRSLAILSIGLVSVLTLSSAQASVAILSGGDSGEGFSPQPVPVYAYNIYGSTTTPDNQTIQGLTFLPFDAQTPPSPITMSGTYGSSYAGGTESTPSGFTATTTSDTALQVMGTTDIHEASGFTITIGDLIASKTYQVDLFVYHSDGNTYGEKFTFNGSQTDLFAGASNVFYDVSESVVADGSGQIIVGMDTLSGPDQTAVGGGGVFTQFGRLNGFAVTTTPEPSAICLLGIGSSALLRRRKRSVMAAL